ncbi:MAG: glutamate-5-semialdehyde dehydrogenase [Lachnospiraceae bacterium]|nr:glutamate-5-semialdehyde dehydrogenase [Lachnospiraceae bacterium]
MDVRAQAHQMKMTAPHMAAMTLAQRNAALQKIIEALTEKQEEIFRENVADVEAAEKSGVAQAVIKRLRFNEGKLKDAISGIRQMIDLPDPVGKVTLNRELDEGLVLQRVTVPIGVIGVIFEARPDALIQISALCIKSGNCAILKGGKETARTNKLLFEVIHEAVIEAGLPEGCLLQVELHNEIDELLQCQGDVDLLIPRGSNSFVQYIMDHTNIPVMGHSSGVCHIYVDDKADEAKIVPIVVDAKTQYPAACNTVETLLVNRKIAGKVLPVLQEALNRARVKIRGTKEVVTLLQGLEVADSAGQASNVAGKITDGAGQIVDVAGKAADGKVAVVELMEDAEFGTEYSDLVISVKLVEDVREAVEHINQFGSHHTDCIITEADDAAEYFMQMVDSAGVYRNCSTRFADGFRYGFGAEVGISTGKLHARGPVGLEGLVTYKYRLNGEGQIVGDYAEGRREFHHRDL